MGTTWARENQVVEGEYTHVIRWSERDGKKVPVTYGCCGETHLRAVESAYRLRKNPGRPCEQCHVKLDFRSSGRIVVSGYIYLHRGLLTPWEFKLAKKMGFQFGDRYIAQHRLVAAEKLGRALRKDEIVHHRDGKKKNNDPDNLLVYPQSLHKKSHRKVLMELAEFYEISE